MTFLKVGRGVLLAAALGWSCLPATGLGQASEKKTTVVSFLNLVPQPVFLSWNGPEAFPKGMVPGQSQGPLKMPGGSIQVRAKAEGFEDKRENQVFPANHRCLLLITEQPADTKARPASGTNQPGILLTQLPPLPEAEAKQGYAWTVLLVGNLPSLTVQANQKTVTLERNQLVVLGRGERFFELTQGGTSLASAGVEEPADYVFVVHANDTNRIQAYTVYR